MVDTFVWFHHSVKKGSDSSEFYGKLLGWKAAPGPGGTTMFTSGEAPPFAGTGEKYGDTVGWIPFVEVKDVDLATKQASKLGGTVVREKTRGPAGEFSIVRDPSGVAIALWQKA